MTPDTSNNGTDTSYIKLADESASARFDAPKASILARPQMADGAQVLGAGAPPYAAATSGGAGGSGGGGSGADTVGPPDGLGLPGRVIQIAHEEAAASEPMIQAVRSANASTRAAAVQAKSRSDQADTDHRAAENTCRAYTVPPNHHTLPGWVLVLITAAGGALGLLLNYTVIQGFGFGVIETALGAVCLSVIEVLSCICIGQLLRRDKSFSSPVLVLVAIGAGVVIASFALRWSWFSANQLFGFTTVAPVWMAVTVTVFSLALLALSIISIAYHDPIGTQQLKYLRNAERTKRRTNRRRDRTASALNNETSVIQAEVTAATSRAQGRIGRELGVAVRHQDLRPVILDLLGGGTEEAPIL